MPERNVLLGGSCSDNGSALISLNKWLFLFRLTQLYFCVVWIGCAWDKYICVFNFFSFFLILVLIPTYSGLFRCFIISWADSKYSNYFQFLEKKSNPCQFMPHENFNLVLWDSSLNPESTQGHQYCEMSLFPPLSLPSSSSPCRFFFLNKSQEGKRKTTWPKCFSHRWCYSGPLEVARRKEVVHWEMHNSQHLEKCVWLLQT